MFQKDVNWAELAAKDHCNSFMGMDWIKGWRQLNLLFGDCNLSKDLFENYWVIQIIFKQILYDLPTFQKHNHYSRCSKGI